MGMWSNVTSGCSIAVVGGGSERGVMGAYGVAKFFSGMGTMMGFLFGGGWGWTVFAISVGVLWLKDDKDARNVLLRRNM
ncbi:hypothetical protein TrVE_jg9170 [Triparma verrucosa]|uniref:Uncharacterized protein n=2 Tax=Triparma TaxID=722752 RepID=A0A9W7ATD5_9STRA|nr:hypothetical protein TrST_g10552 [Triparma strigata]GMH99055.1 hypothetical protein TrVE_jg9170 [Triparma verrucosa]